MSALTIESLGLSKEELTERLVRTLADDPDDPVEKR